MNPLSEMACVACRGGEPAISVEEISKLLPEIPDWRIRQVEGVNRLERVFRFRDFAGALEFTNRVGAAAEAQDHHPAILTEWGRVTVSWWTHTVRGLHKNDFIMAAKTDSLFG